MKTQIFRSKKKYMEALCNVYAFHTQVYNTILALLKRKGDIELKRGIRFCFLDMEVDSCIVHAVRLSEDRKYFYLDATSENGDEYRIGWEQINHDMIITEWLMSLKWPDTYSESYNVYE